MGFAPILTSYLLITHMKYLLCKMLSLLYAVMVMGGKIVERWSKGTYFQLLDKEVLRM